MRELKAYTLFTTSSLSGQRVYLTNDADAAIAELKARIQLDDDEMARFLQLEEECGGGDLRNYIAELKQKLHDAEMRADLAEAAETERKIDYDNLKKKLAESAKKSYLKHFSDKEKEHRQTLRALWLCRYGLAHLQYLIYRKMGAAFDMLYWYDKQVKFKVKADTFKEDK